MKKKVLVAMSGGVDSTYSAIILKELGYDTIGVTFKIADTDNANEAVNDAKNVCDSLKMEHIVVDYSEIFKREIIDHFVSEYKSGLTPNPCVICNKTIKFGELNKLRIELGADYIATGHYVKIEEEQGIKYLKKANYLKKDQTYFLNQIPRGMLDFLIFPLGNVESKEEIRQFLKDRNIDIASKKDSQEICFIEDGDTVNFLSKYIPFKKGIILDENNNELGKHIGSWKYTMGQRRGLGVSSKKPLYVLRTDVVKNIVYLGDVSSLLSKEAVISSVNILAKEIFENKKDKLYAKIRYRGKEEKIKSMEIIDEKIKIIFEDNQKSITNGQYLVVYYKDILVLGGKII